MKTAEFNKAFPQLKKDVKELLKKGFKAEIYDTEISFFKKSRGGMFGVSFDMGGGYTVKQLQKLGKFVLENHPLKGKKKR